MTIPVRRCAGGRPAPARLVGAAVVGMLLASMAGAAQEVLAVPDLSGSWELNQERSDDPGERVDEAMRNWVGRPAGPGGSRGGGPASGAGDQRRQVREQVEALVAAPRVITITHAEPVLTLESALPDSPFEQTLYTDGRKFTRPGARGGVLEASARWQRGGRLAVEYATASGRQVRETWELVAEGARVLVATELTGKGMLPSVRVQRVYDRVEIVPWAVAD